jgi:hypothetical protein
MTVPTTPLPPPALTPSRNTDQGTLTTLPQIETVKRNLIGTMSAVKDLESVALGGNRDNINKANILDVSARAQTLLGDVVAALNTLEAFVLTLANSSGYRP